MSGHTIAAALGQPELWLAAFAGGAFGAALGALPAFAFTGFMVIAGEVANAIGGQFSSAFPALSPGDIGVGITGSVALGPVFGPHVSFAGGAAATAYAARKGYVDTGFVYHEAKNVTHALGTKPDVLAVGGAFGILGMVLRQVSGGLGLPWDPIAMGVVLSALCHRLAFGYPLVGTVHGDGLLDMRPFARDQRRPMPGGERTAPDGGASHAFDTTADAAEGPPADNLRQRLAVEPWLPHQYEWPNVASIGLVAGILGAYVAIATGSAFLAFGISAATLLFLATGVSQVPVTHHVTLTASTAALAVSQSGSAVVAGADTLLAVLFGTLIGMLTALAAELFQRVFYAHGDTHWDPPAAGIVAGTLLLAVLGLAGVVPVTGGQVVWIPLPG